MFLIDKMIESAKQDFQNNNLEIEPLFQYE
jgi:hypothetical protein